MRVADYSSRPIDIIGGSGCTLTDKAGKTYLDFIGGWCVGTIGWQHPQMIAALTQALTSQTFVPAVLRHPPQEDFAQLLLTTMPKQKVQRAFRCTSGSEAVEFAIKCARASTGKPTIVSIAGVYHGHTYGAASVGDACRAQLAPCLPNFLKLPMPNAYHRISADKVIAQLEQLLTTHTDIAAFISEPVWTNGGVVIPPPNFYPRIEQLCRQHGVLFVMDEVATGCGRCGRWLASELWNLTPDIICLGKGLTGGYATLATTLVTEEIFHRSRGIPAYSTFGWLMTDLAATRCNVELMQRDRLWENAAQVGQILLQQLQPLSTLPFVGEVRGIGLLIGIEIVTDKTSKQPNQALAEKICGLCAEAGLLIEAADHVLFLSPPLVLSAAEAKQGAAILSHVVQQL